MEFCQRGFKSILSWLVIFIVSLFMLSCSGGGGGGSATITSPSSVKAITAYSFVGAAGVINEAAKTISVTVPNGTNVTNLVATFSTTGVNVKVGATVQTSTSSANNFTTPVSYVVTAADGSSVVYSVSVIVAPSSAKAITSYSFAGYSGAAGVINEAAKTISVTVPNGTNVTNLVATFSTTGVNVKVGATVQTSTSSANNFTTPVSYVVTAADGSSVVYSVSVIVAPSSAKAITSYSFAGYSGAAGVINEAAKTISVTVPNGTNVTNLVATFSTTGVNVKVGATVQTSTSSANNFTTPVSYIVTAADGSSVVYSVSVATGLGPIPIFLGMANNFALLSKAGITDIPLSNITGNVGASPITGAAIGVTCAEVTGIIYSTNAAGPVPCSVTAVGSLATAVSDMEAAYSDAASRAVGVVNVGAGSLGGQNLAPGTYTWGTAVTLPIGTNLTLSGGPNDVWIFQIAGDLTTAVSTNVFLVGGALPENVFWQVGGSSVTLGANAHFEGIILTKFAINFGNQASINGRLLAQTAINLNQNTIIQPLN